MSNPEHVTILKQGVKVWNSWMEEVRADRSIRFRADLSGSNFNKENLRRVDLSIANLSNANLSNADLNSSYLQSSNLKNAILINADLYNSDLSDANLSEADLTNTNLTDSHLGGATLLRAKLFKATLFGTDLRGVDLSDADLSESNFRGANLSGANLHGADFSNSKIGYTLFSSVDLRYTKGLMSINHSSPSPISTDTLMISEGQIPEYFLRGCGLKDWEIEQAKLYNPSLSNTEINDILYRVYDLRSKAPLQFHTCFISYSHQDEAFAKKLHDSLQESGVRCWYAPEEMKGGKKIHHQLRDAINIHDKLILILSEQSMNSDWVAYEIKQARKREKQENRQILFPLRLVEWSKIKKWELFHADTVTDLAEEVRTYFIPDFRGWEDDEVFEKAFVRLLHDLRFENGGTSGES